MGNVTNWDEQAYRHAIRAELRDATTTIFAARFAPQPWHILATASSHGNVSLYSISSCTPPQAMNLDESKSQHIVEPALSLSGHDGPAYDLKFYGEGEDALLLSCGDDGRIQGWRWQDISRAMERRNMNGKRMEPAFTLINPQHKFLRGALSPMPETNAIDTNPKAGFIYSAAGNGLAYSWDVEKGRICTVFEGHCDYLHTICARPSCNQVITGSEDGTARIWDCRSAKCIAILDTWRATRVHNVLRNKSPWVSCIALDSSENWLVSGNGGGCATLWSLPGLDAVTRISTLAPPQAIAVAGDQIMVVGAQPHLSRFSFSGRIISQVACATLSAFSISLHPSGMTAVGGYGGLVDILSEFGSHLSIFRCK